MSIEDLRHVVTGLTGLKLEPILDDNLDRENPACVPDSGEEIHIYSGLNKEERVQAEGHELAHLMLEYQGLVVLGGNMLAHCHFDIPEYEDIYEWMPHINFLALELTMAIHHKEVFSLNAMYAILNDLQKNSRYTVLEKMMEELEVAKKFPTLHHGYGFQLYDVHRTITALDDYMKPITKEYPEVAKAFIAANAIVPEICANKSLDIQFGLCKTIVQSLGYDGEVIILRNRFLRLPR